MKGKLIALACMILSVVIMAQPNGVAMTFGPSSTKKVTSYFSYFSPMPFGYGNWFPIITAILSIVIVVLLIISFKKNVIKSIQVFFGIIVAASLLSWIVFDAFSIIGLTVFALHIIAFAIQIIQSIRVKRA